MQFSSFLSLKKLKGKQLPATYWQIEPPLEKNIRLLLDGGLERNEEVIATSLLLFLRQQEDKLRERHLTAYFQECCFFASRNVSRRLEGYSNSLTWEDYFRWSNSLAIPPQRLLAHYNPYCGTKLATYARHKIESQLVDEAYRYLGWKRASDWGLLKQFKPASRRKCLEIIEGFRGETLQQYLLVWECFCLIYFPPVTGKSQPLPSPSTSDFVRISQEYNFLASKHNPPLPPLDAGECERIIKICITCARNYCNPKMVFFDEPPDIASEDNQWQEEVYTQQDYETINGIIQSAYEDLNPCQKIIFLLWLGLQMPQTTIAQILSANYGNYIRQQYLVSREINAARNCILKRIIGEVIGDNFSIFPVTIKGLKLPLDEGLTIQGKQTIFQLLYAIYNSLYSQKKNLFFGFLANRIFPIYSRDLSSTPIPSLGN